MFLKICPKLSRNQSDIYVRERPKRTFHFLWAFFNHPMSLHNIKMVPYAIYLTKLYSLLGTFRYALLF